MQPNPGGPSLVASKDIPGEQLKPIASSHNTADMRTLVQAELVDDPAAKIRIYAAARFPSLPVEEAVKRYRIARDGTVEYIDNDQQIYQEADSGMINSIKRGVARLISEAPATGGGIVGGIAGGIAGGPLGAAAGLAGGAATGEYGRMKLAEGLGDKPKGGLETAGQMGKAAVGAVVGEGLGKASVGILNRMRRAGTGEIGKLATRDVAMLNPQEVERIIELGRKYGIEVTAPEASNSPTLKAAWNFAAQTPGEAAEKILDWADNVRDPQLKASIDRELRMIFPESSVYEASRKGVEAASAARASLEGQRTGATTPLYQQAFSEGATPDVFGVIQKIDELASKYPAKSPTRGILEKYKGYLQKEEEIPIYSGRMAE